MVDRLYFRPEASTELLALPWADSLSQWQNLPLLELPIGLCRHTVRFIELEQQIYAIKELPDQWAENEYLALKALEDQLVPAVKAIGHVHPNAERSLLITRYLDHALPYRLILLQPAYAAYREHLYDAMASLLVQLHLKKFFWGDCSLSNTLFRQDAGRLQAYLVDAESSEIHIELSAAQREYDLELMRENVAGALADLIAEGKLDDDYPFLEIPDEISTRYAKLWDEINHSEAVPEGQKFRIQERIQKLNKLGFSVDEVLMKPVDQGQVLEFRVMVTDRHFHKQQLERLTGLVAEEKQAQRLLNEIQAIRGELSQQEKHSVSLSRAAQHWLAEIYSPLAQKIHEANPQSLNSLELYCLLQDHKWYLSEKAGQDVGSDSALQDFLTQILPNWLAGKHPPVEYIQRPERERQ